MKKQQQKILIVDDQRIMRELLKAILRGVGEIELAESGEQALEKVSQSKPDLILLDVTMPGIDGYEVCQRIKTNPSTSDIHIIFMTGLDRNEDEIKALEVGATDFIKKPPVPKIVSARVKNILKLQKVTHELFIMSRTDPLTGAFNRRHFMETGAAELNRSSRYGSTFSMIMLDIDHFKSINDTYGHDIGDKALIEAVQIINKALRTEDTLGRFGGEEFCILLPETSQKSAIKVAERIRSDIEANKIHTDKGALKFTVSCGISQLNTTNNSLEKIIKNADNALYNSKKSGRNRTTAAEEIQD